MFINKYSGKMWGPHISFDYNLASQVVGIIGPNGSGKSNLIAGLKFLLTGETDENLETYVNDHAKEGSLSMSFVHGGVPGTMSVSVGHKTSRILTIGEAKYTKSAEVKEAMSHLFDVGSKAVSSAVFITQGETTKMLFGERAEREKTMMKLCGVDYITANEGPIMGEINRLSTGLVDLQAALASAEERLRSDQAARDAAEAEAGKAYKPVGILDQLRKLGQQGTSDSLVAEYERQVDDLSARHAALLQERSARFIEALIPLSRLGLSTDKIASSADKGLLLQTVLGKLLSTTESERADSATLTSLKEKLKLEKSQAMTLESMDALESMKEGLQRQLELAREVRMHKQSLDRAEVVLAAEEVVRKGLTDKATVNLAEICQANDLPDVPAQADASVFRSVQRVINLASSSAKAQEAVLQSAILAKQQLISSTQDILSRHGKCLSADGDKLQCHKCGLTLHKDSLPSEARLAELRAELEQDKGKRVALQVQLNALNSFDTVNHNLERQYAASEAKVRTMREHADSLLSILLSLPMDAGQADKEFAKAQDELVRVDQKMTLRKKIDASLQEINGAIASTAERLAASVASTKVVMDNSNLKDYVSDQTFLKDTARIKSASDMLDIMLATDARYAVSERDLKVQLCAAEATVVQMKARAEQERKDKAALLAEWNKETRSQNVEHFLYKVQSCNIEAPSLTQTDAILQHRAAYLAIAEGMVAYSDECKGKATAMQFNLEQSQKAYHEISDAMQRDAGRRELISELRLLKELVSRKGIPLQYATAKFQQIAIVTADILEMMDAPFTIRMHEEEPFAFQFVDSGTGSDAWKGMGKLSGGQRMRLSIAFLIAAQQVLLPKVGFLVLDEPSTHLDAEAVQDLVPLLEQASRYLGAESQIWVIDHHEILQRAFDDVIVLKANTPDRLAEGPVDDKKPRNRKAKKSE